MNTGKTSTNTGNKKTSKMVANYLKENEKFKKLKFPSKYNDSLLIP